MKEQVFYIRDRRLPYHYTIDNEVYDMRLGVYGLAVYNAFARHASYEGETREQAALSHKRLAKELRCGVTSVKKGIGILRKAGLIKTEKAVGGASVYVLLEVPKQAPEKKYVRRADQGGSHNTPNHTDSVDRQNTANPSRNTAKGSRPTTKGGQNAPDRNSRKYVADKAVKARERDSKRKSLTKENLGRAPRASLSESQKYGEELWAFNKRVTAWHQQCEKITGKSYDLTRVSLWCGVRTRQLGLEKVKEVFERIANGANPYIDSFWKALKSEAEKVKAKTAPVEESMLGKPIELQTASV